MGDHQMRNSLLVSAALLGLTAAAVFAQAPPSPGSGDRAAIAPALPTPPLDQSASPRAFLEQAQEALGRHRPGEAQEALERAETRMLDRSVVPSRAAVPDSTAGVEQIRQARDALTRRDVRAAQQIIANALASIGAGTPPSGAPSAAPLSGGAAPAPTNGGAGSSM
jgi:hypothetical protein